MCRYGPFWICTTLIFVAASIGTFVTYVAHKLQKKEWDYDINLMTWSAGLFYGYVTLVPLGLYLILKYFSAPSGLVQLFCLYGYSLFVFIPALVSLLISNFTPLQKPAMNLAINMYAFTASEFGVPINKFKNIFSWNACLISC